MHAVCGRNRYDVVTEKKSITSRIAQNRAYQKKKKVSAIFNSGTTSIVDKYF